MLRISVLGARLCGALAAALVFGAPIARADGAFSATDWTLQNVVLDDGGQITGSFTVSSATGAITGWNLTTTAGSWGYGGFTYNSVDSAVVEDGSSFGGFAFELKQQSIPGGPLLLAADARTLFLYFIAPFPITPADIAVDSENFVGGGFTPAFECLGKNCEDDVGNDVSQIPVPGAINRRTCAILGCPIGFAFVADTARDRHVPGVVPEPASWALMLIGFGAVGSLIRRRRPQGIPLTS